MFYYKLTYKLQDTKTNEEFLVLIYCQSQHDKFNRSDLPGAIKDSIYSLPHIEELELHGIESISREEYDQRSAEIKR